MLIFEITKTNTPLPQKGLAPILIALPHTYVAYATQAMISSVKQSKTNVTPCLHRMRAARQNTIEVIIISDTVYTGCCAARRDKSLTVNCCRVLFMTCWHKCQRSLPLLDFSPVLESWSDIYTGPTSCLIVPQTCSSFVFYPPSLSLCHSAWLMSVLCTERFLLHIMSRHTPYSWLATSLFWYSAPTQFSEAFLKNDIPHL